MKAEVENISTPAAWLAIASSLLTVLLLASLHLLSPEFDPSSRMVSEYALGDHEIVLSLMFGTWALSSWALAWAIRSQASTAMGTVGLLILILAGVGEALASLFDIRNAIGHGVAGILGVIGLPIAAMLISVSLLRSPAWHLVGETLVRLAHLTWISVVLLIGTMILMTLQFEKVSGGKLPSHGPKSLPPGVVGLDGWANRLIVVTFCFWVGAAAWKALKLRNNSKITRHY